MVRITTAENVRLLIRRKPGPALASCLTRIVQDMIYKPKRSSTIGLLPIVTLPVVSKFVFKLPFIYYSWILQGANDWVIF